jgi:lipoate-protein ligase A
LRWRIERSVGAVAELLEPWPPADRRDRPAVRTATVIGRGAVVLGSTQKATVVDHQRAEAAGIDVVRRSTGGGAVLVAPAGQVWLDFWLPRGHELWDDDIIGAARWLGDAWRRALEGMGGGRLHVHDGPATRGPWPDLVCFAGLGPGELYRSEPETGGRADDVKVTGLAQRRTSAGARFHTSAPLSWDPTPLLDLLVVDDIAAAADENSRSLTGVAIGLRSLLLATGGDVTGTDLIVAVEDAVIAALP